MHRELFCCVIFSGGAEGEAYFFDRRVISPEIAMHAGGKMDIFMFFYLLLSDYLCVICLVVIPNFFSVNLIHRETPSA